VLNENDGLWLKMSFITRYIHGRIMS